MIESDRMPRPARSQRSAAVAASLAGSRAYAISRVEPVSASKSGDAADERVADAGEQLERLGRHQPADHRAHGRQDAGDLARVGFGVGPSGNRSR